MGTLLSPKFHVRGSSINAWVDQAGGVPQQLLTDSGTTVVSSVSSADTGAFGGTMLSMASLTKVRGLVYPGFQNVNNVAAFSALFRIIPRWTGSGPTYSTPLMYAQLGYPGSLGNWVYIDATGKLFLHFSDKFGSQYIAALSSAAYNGWTSGTAVDVLVTWDGTASAANYYINGTLIGTITVAAGSPLVDTNYGALSLGVSPAGVVADYDLNEMILWDYKLSAGDITTLSARSTFLGTIQFDATQNTDPGIANVRTGTTYYAAGILETGTCAVPVANNVLNGVATDATTGNVVLPTAGQVQVGVAFGSSSGTTGTYNGSDRWTDPGSTNVRSGTAYKANSTSNNQTGSCAVPTAAQVQIGVAVDATTGIYTGADRWTDPGSTHVKIGVTYQANSVTPNETGTYSGADRWTDPGSTNVKHGVTYQANSLTPNETGTYFGNDEWSDPGSQNVLAGVTYLADGVTETGTLALINNTFTQLQLTVNPTPPNQALVMTQGDITNFNFLAIGANGLPFNLTNSTFKTKMLQTDGTYLYVPNSGHTPNSNQATNPGQFALSIGGTQKLQTGTVQIITTVISGGTTLQFHGTIQVLPSEISR